ncbi:MAG: HlyD family efflux transporter periplasmic adaptor subunit, partial [Desulfobacterales bacterium]|nr:HlyD family efflux transporter periplasmic adaptor subunit [Desulfobacterales bacterium]
AEYTRLKSLYEKNRMGALSNVEAAEQSYNSLLDSEKILLKTISLYPLQIAEARGALADARADLKTARLNVRRCVVTAPFTGRVKSASIETGAYVTTGTPVLTLADDAILEVRVGLSDKDAFENLGLRTIEGAGGLPSNLKEIQCRVKTVTGNVSADLPAILDRIVKYDSDARSLYLAVRISRDAPHRGEAGIPIMDGMFCKVFLKGKQVENAVRIPASALNPDNTVYLARDNQLKTLPVQKIMENGDHIYISGTFAPRDRIITTALTTPIEHSRLEISDAPIEQKSSTRAAKGELL